LRTSPAATRPEGDRAATSGVPLLDIRGLSVELRMRRRTVHPVNDVWLALPREETLGLVGESGSGKTMLSLAVMGLLPRPFGRIVGGEILFDGENIATRSEAALRRIRGDRISMVFQEPMTSLDPLFTIGSQIVETIRAHRNVDRSEARELAISMLERVHIPSARERFSAYPHELSGGMRQRAMIAMALCLQPELLLADEPTTALDVTVQAQILELIADLQSELQMGVLLITHNLAVVREVADRVAVMYAGEIVELATTEELFRRPQHPYTQGLMRSIPKERRVRRLHVIPGRPPDLTRVPTGCPFAPRCPQVIARCESEHPLLEATSAAPAHRFRCWNPRELTEP
jgi:oligopeptide/dipeptide ABC transporter ATP-binding protein